MLCENWVYRKLPSFSSLLKVLVCKMFECIALPDILMTFKFWPVPILMDRLDVFIFEVLCFIWLFRVLQTQICFSDSVHLFILHSVKRTHLHLYTFFACWDYFWRNSQVRNNHVLRPHGYIVWLCTHTYLIENPGTKTFVSEDLRLSSGAELGYCQGTQTQNKSFKYRFRF